MTGGGRLAQPGLKATLKALGAGGCCTLLAVCEDMRGSSAPLLQPLAGLSSRGAVADFLSELSERVTSRPGLFSITRIGALTQGLRVSLCTSRALPHPQRRRSLRRLYLNASRSLDLLCPAL